MKAFVVRAVMPIPMVVADMLGLVDFPVYVTFHFGFPV
jgi:hypothetical protein